MKKTGALVSIIFLLIFFSQSLFAQKPDLKSEIYSKLKCAYGVSFDNCPSPEAIEIRGYIAGLLEGRFSEDEIIYKVAKKYTPDSILDENIKSRVEKRLIKEAGKNRPQIVLEPMSFDFGSVTKNQGKLTKVFKLQNKGNSDLVITNIRVSCSCTTVSLKAGKNKSPDFAILGALQGWKETIKPGESGDLAVVLDVGHPSMTVGKHARSVFISSNDPLYPQVTIKVEAQVTGSNAAVN